MFQSIIVSVRSKFYSLWTFIFRKRKMPEIRLNCFVISSNFLIEKITWQHIVTIDIDKKESIHSLRSKKGIYVTFQDIPIIKFVIHAVKYSSNDLEKANIIALFLSIKNRMSQKTELFSISNIFKYFPK